SLAAGGHRIVVEVRDTAGTSGFAERLLVSAATTDTWVVTNPDLNEVGTSPLLSLTEAINAVNSGAKPNQAITFAADGMHLTGAELPALTQGSVTLIGRSGVRLTFEAQSSTVPCLRIQGDNSRVIGLDLA